MEVVVRLVSLCLFYVSLVLGVEIIDVVEQSVFGQGNECYGTHVGFGYSGGAEFHYESLIRRYQGCKHVEGNLEITNLQSSAKISYDLSFLSKIEVVTGYVLIGLLDVESIPLTSLKLIRADNMFNIMGKDYGLVVAFTDSTGNNQKGLRELQLPALREISNGRVLFLQNPLLNYVNTISWNGIVPGVSDPVTYGESAYNMTSLEVCDAACTNGNQRYCWGKGPNMCQSVHYPVCDELCPGRCYDSTIVGCCHPECAVGCTGPSNVDCFMCKYFKSDSLCVSSCPWEVSARNGQDCLKK
ncbi:epidermal growth factor receptor-like [Ostrea edulis]|uniref:epidermal growth factor receptor-like n=1 Tax=Ostrea edulis TaxID=37623 RepID=UPI0020947AD2|nr:epidermal growth factor receptor-like [Ostrea edulis]